MNGCNEECSWEDIYDSGQLDEQLENFDSDQLEPIGIPRDQQGEQSTVDTLNKSDKQIKILKRSEASREGEVERVHPENRTLIEQSVAQREKDYAVARERIMGTKSNSKPSGRRDRNNHRRNNQSNGNQRQPG